MKSVAEEIGDLRLMDVPGLVEKYETLFGRAPRSKNRDWLFHKCAWRVQEVRFGGLSTTAKKRLDELTAEIELPTAVRTSPSANRDGLAIGTEIVREWRGREIHVHVRDNGYEFEGTIYKSLSAAANAVTGAHWNGRLFFGVKR